MEGMNHAVSKKAPCTADGAGHGGGTGCRLGAGAGRPPGRGTRQDLAGQPAAASRRRPSAALRPGAAGRPAGTATIHHRDLDRTTTAAGYPAWRLADGRNVGCEFSAAPANSPGGGPAVYGWPDTAFQKGAAGTSRIPVADRRPHGMRGFIALSREAGVSIERNGRSAWPVGAHAAAWPTGAVAAVGSGGAVGGALASMRASSMWLLACCAGQGRSTSPPRSGSTAATPTDPWRPSGSASGWASLHSFPATMLELRLTHRPASRHRWLSAEPAGCSGPRQAERSPRRRCPVVPSLSSQAS
jgi:hypothetical protein